VDGGAMSGGGNRCNNRGNRDAGLGVYPFSQSGGGTLAIV